MNLRLQKKVFLAMFISSCFCGLNTAKGQTKGGVGIGTTTPDKSAILDLSSNEKGLLLPRMSLQERTEIKSPARGLMLYQTNFMSGLYIYDGKTWISIGSTEVKLTTNDNSVWGTLGNAGLNSADHFIGTTDQTSIVFKVNNQKSGLIDSERGNLFLGFRTGQNSTAFNSVALGALAMQKANTSGNNIAIGFQSMFQNESGGNNIAIGSGSLVANLSGYNNVSIGSLAGYKSLGSGNVFLGFQSGYDEQGNDKLVIGNNANRLPLIYGDFLQGKIGLNTRDLDNTLNINSNQNHKSGLRFTKLTNQSPQENPSGKVLSVDINGNVILTSDLVGEASTAFWTVNGENIQNSNQGSVNILSNLSVTGGITANTLALGGQLRLPYINQTDKILGLDASGNIIPVDAPTGGGSVATGSTGYWSMNASGDLVPELSNSKRVAMFGMSLGWGGIKFRELNSTYEEPFPSNGLALSLDEFGNMILTKNSDGGSSSGGGTVGGTNLWTNSGNIIHTLNDNKVAIGQGLATLPEGYLLYVKKGILAERVRVAVATSANWADYVFDDDYKLMPLNEVEAFIKANDHLPNVPSANEIVDKGIDMAEMASKQMEKIEELTLYLIEANKRIEKLEKEIYRLK
jgi:hypothetical protein